MSIEPQIVISIWLEVKREVRDKIATIMSMSRNGATEVAGGRVICDGFTNDDLKGITVEKMQKYLKSKEVDLFQLFNALIAKVEAELPAAKVVGATSATVPEPLVFEPVEDKRLYRIPPTKYVDSSKKKVKKSK